MSKSNPKILLYVIIGTVIVTSIIGMITSAIASSRASNVTTASSSKNPAIVSAISNTVNIILGSILIYLVYKTAVSGVTDISNVPGVSEYELL